MTPTGPTRTFCGVVLAALLSGLAVTGCSQERDPASAPEEHETRILQPGSPGDAMETIGPEDVPEGAEWNHSDAGFVQAMVPHHAQALEMCALARSRAESPQVLALARRIRGAQGPEIVTLAAWLEQRGLAVPTIDDDPKEFDHGEHGHTPMAGMLTAEQMVELREAQGRRFDELFLRGMIRHHAGAVQMAQAVAEDGSDTTALEIADEVSAGQAAEIERMRRLLRQL